MSVPLSAPASPLQNYYKPMLEATKTQKEIPADLINVIFSNMEVILPLNRDYLLKELTQRMDNWSTDQLIGDIFVRFGPFLKMYTKYNDGFDSAMKVLSLLLSRLISPLGPRVGRNAALVPPILQRQGPH